MKNILSNLLFLIIISLLVTSCTTSSISYYNTNYTKQIENKAYVGDKFIYFEYGNDKKAEYAFELIYLGSDNLNNVKFKFIEYNNHTVLTTKYAYSTLYDINYQLNSNLLFFKGIEVKIDSINSSGEIKYKIISDSNLTYIKFNNSIQMLKNQAVTIELKNNTILKHYLLLDDNYDNIFVKLGLDTYIIPKSMILKLY